MVSIPSSPRPVGDPGVVQSFAQLCRPTLSVLAALVGCLTIYALNPVEPGLVYLLIAMVLACMTAGAFAINDYDDIEKDRINHPERPLPSGTLLPQQAWWVAVILFCGSLLAAIPLGLLPLLLVSVSAFLLWNYSAILMVSGILGNGVVAIIVAAAIVLASLVAGRPLAMLYPSAFLFCYILAKEIVWDIHDVVGDRNRSITTLANRWGIQPAFYTAWGLLTLLLISIPIAIAHLGMVHPLLFGICTAILLVSFALALLRYQRVQTASTYRSLIVWGRIGMILGLIGLLGTAPPL
ncbi:MAG: UbiA family prenyltransferase [Acaryochloris sp. RU_4_1]|nr:UbiA family prenyltransferase [Acaryochloris sp. RU_4_1]NJR56786.1 UbiA family prenyltransferase [Acaryochloris sp. CRU_2_0]